MILIEAPPVYGKSASTLFASDYWDRQGLRPIRIRIRDLPIEKQQLWEALESSVARVSPEGPQPDVLSSLARVDKPFQDGTIFTTARKYGDAEICPYVLILDGWDEVAAGATTEYRDLVA